MPRVGIVEIFSLYNPNHTNYVLFAIYTSICALNVLFASLLFAYDTGSSDILDVFDIKDILKDTDHYFFFKGTSDCMWLAIFEIIVLPLIAWRAIIAGRLPDDIENITQSKTCECFRCFYGKRNKYAALKISDKDKTDPLLTDMESPHSRRTSTDDDEAVKSDGTTTIQEGTSIQGYATADAEKKLEMNTSAKRFLEMKDKYDRHKSMWLFGLFLVSTAAQVYIGLKCITFEYKNERRDGFLMGMSVLWVNLMVWCLREIITNSTKETGEHIPSLHVHRLYMYSDVTGHWCDACHQRVSGGRAYRCNICDFDLCIRCHAKKSTVAMEGQLRGDKGVRSEEELTGSEYFKRALRLAGTEWMLFLVAMMFLLLSNALNLFLPHIQGSILDAVVQGDLTHFDNIVRTYLFISLLSGFVGGAQSLCFNIVGRKLSNTVRRRLFKGIMVQDVAFFDGNTSGQLTSRISNDVSFMVQPIQSMLGTLVSNTVLLLGGIGMCFFTSWRLSMLAFVTVGPIIHITQIYASWSQQLNRQIYMALATANGFATEALGNIRTVKAFATELRETERYDEAIVVALQRGITDAFGGAGMYTINSYLDLGAGVLILWYGGILAMEGKDGLTAGRLITYQLYWNMLNNAYKGLLDILTSFTRAGAAAQRVFALMDSLPDIDLDKGKPVPHIQGSLSLEKVSFAYQMRPNHLVLNNVSLHIPAGSTCALVGRSGGGKSTLVNMLLRFYDPHEGTVLLDGQNICDLKLRDVRRRFGVVQQSTELFGGSIEENIAYGMEADSWTREDVILAAKQACAHEFICSFPEGYSTRVGERGVRISGGQRQRIAIARVFLRRPQVLLLDEATSALDAESEAQVQEALDRLMGNNTNNINTATDTDTLTQLPTPGKPTIILVAHRLSTVINADQIAVINNGEIVEKGNHRELLEKGGTYAKLVERQLKQRASIVDADRAASEGVSDFDLIYAESDSIRADLSTNEQRVEKEKEKESNSLVNMEREKEEEREEEEEREDVEEEEEEEEEV
eukprot:CAMPEP_0182439544 /NCGR_PEP_ID=MMETSP1167-20130531/86506_1 /TAXON_ID=2988 /ORGANISM="Mallomonas Sp, Strain CCMP3275" /LENGTH=1022 /DNA_ID=CAMNT_0024633277 /DNA_START=169 /DNA_END=3238 /DNA_ORIENTATION=+